MGTSPIHYLEEVVLNSTGDAIEGSLSNRVIGLYNANYTLGRVYPTLTDGVTVLSDNTDWGLGAFTTIVPANQIASAYHLSAVVVETCNRDGVFEMPIYYGAGQTLMSTIRFSYLGGFFGNSIYLTPSVKIPANDKIDVKLAYSDGFTVGVATITVSVIYRILES
jgi:hypothetical protein